MNITLKQYPKGLERFKTYYQEKLKEFQTLMYKEHLKNHPGDEVKSDVIPNFSLEEIERIAINKGSILFEFFDDQEIYTSLYYNGKNFKFNIVNQSIMIENEQLYDKRIDAEYTAINECFKILNDKQ